MNTGSGNHQVRIWLTFGGILAMVSLVYALGWWLDFGADGHSFNLFTLWRQPGGVESFAGMAEVAAAVLGIALTVVAIVVELAATRYTSRITELFLRDWTNRLVTGFMVTTVVVVLWVSLSLGGAQRPVWLMSLAAVMMSASLLLLLPYFGYVFHFLAPEQVIRDVADDAVRAVRLMGRKGARVVPRARHEVLTAVDQLGDMTLNAIKNDEKAIAISSLRGLTSLATGQLIHKPQLPDAWFDTESLAEADADFVALDPEMVEVIAQRRTWVEMKILRAFQTSYRQAIHHMPDINQFIAIQTRIIAAEAITRHEHDTLRLCTRFFNTWLRETVRVGDQRGAYLAMNEYRVLGEFLLDEGWVDALGVLAMRMRFYGQLGRDKGVGFILETAAHDLARLLERAWRAGAPRADCHDRLLDVFLSLDREAGDEAQARAERGVRRAQAKLAAFYLHRGGDQHASRIAEDMAQDAPQRLVSIRDELLALTDPEWWEVSNRETNWDYVPEEERDALRRFFADLGI